MNKFFVVFFILLLSFQFLKAQNSNRKTSEIQINVKTEALEKTLQPQELSCEINKNNQETPGYLSIGIENIDSDLTLVSAKLRDEDLWLINSTVSSTNENVVAWNFDKENSRLVIYPYRWNSPYVLDLNIQVNVKNIPLIENISIATVSLIIELSGGLFEALPSGQGNEIQIK